ncbi:MAG TPA: hypothetical protein DIT01_17630 [Lentisphaeria bacterium]|jgi:hypothetical protein|nr:hypothetical protein [Lentisphaeria bacterium]HCN09749.1 hypothetical protein [Lentisphaeria bacterium]|tara:strand:- start:1989 stop:2882 length:894 start_codon:yes stop_codon:yes gene_type:complete
MLDKQSTEAGGLSLQFADGFDQAFDMTTWMKYQGDVRTEKGYAVLDAVAAPGEWGDASICTRGKQFNPGLQGTNGAEVTFVGHTQGSYGSAPHNQDHPEHIGNPLSGPYITGMCLTIANYHGPIVPHDGEAQPEITDDEQIDSDLMSGYRASGTRPSARRGVQIHFDWMHTWGLDYFLCRDLLPEDYGKYPEWNVHLDTLEEIMAQGQFVAGAPFALVGRHYHPDQVNNPLGRRYGLYLTDDGNAVSWTLDGKIMDTVAIPGFFTPESVRDGAYVSIAGAGYQPHFWMIDDVEIYTS